MKKKKKQTKATEDVQNVAAERKEANAGLKFEDLPPDERKFIDAYRVMVSIYGEKAAYEITTDILTKAIRDEEKESVKKKLTIINGARRGV